MTGTPSVNCAGGVEFSVYLGQWLGVGTCWVVDELDATVDMVEEQDTGHGAPTGDHPGKRRSTDRQDSVDIVMCRLF
jgi:hypothetical protein